MEIASLVSSILGIAISILAIWLSLEFYARGRDTERRVEVALAEIKAQTEVLQKLTGRTMDRLTRYATEPKPADEVLLHLVGIIREIPQSIAARLGAPSDGTDVDALRHEILAAYIAAYFYVGTTNFAFQAALPDDRPDAENIVVSMVDQSYGDALTLEGLIGRFRDAEIRASALHHLYLAAMNVRPQLRNTDMLYESRRNSR